MKKGIRAEVKKIGPLKLAAWNGLVLPRMPLPDDEREEHQNIKASNDERVIGMFQNPLTEWCSDLSMVLLRP